VRIFVGLLAAAAWGFQAIPTPSPAAATTQEFTHQSQVLGGNRTYRAILPPGYAASKKRYPVLYWFHGYEQGDDEREAELARYVAGHDLIVINTGPVEMRGEFPQYFPELADQVDRTLRTIADRDHRGVSGFASGGFMALWTAGKFPDLVSSASSFMGYTAASVGPRNLDTEYFLDDAYANYDGVRTRLVTAANDLHQFYQRRLNSMWTYARTGHETEPFDAEHVSASTAKTLDFHMHAFANPLPKPAMFQHADVYPNFKVWGWEVVSDRRQPGFTVLENVSRTGFRCSVREWVPGGSVIPRVKVSIASAPMYPPGSAHAVTIIRVRDGNQRRATLKADAQGRLNFDLDGDAYEVGISVEPVLTITGYTTDGTAWASAGGPVKLRVTFLNKGRARSGTANIKWESPNPGVKFEPASSRLFDLAPGESASLNLTVTEPDASRPILQMFAVDGAVRIPMEIPLFPAAAPVRNFHLADGQSIEIYQGAAKPEEVMLGDGNQDGQAAPGERFAVLIPEGEFFRAAEVFTNDPCVDTGMRAYDDWNDYDHAGVPAVYTIPAIRADCQPGHIVHLLARWLAPNAPDHQVRFAAIDFPVWYRSDNAEPERGR
jgi:hypothetical protein